MIFAGVVLMLLSGAFWAASGVVVAAGTTKKVSMAEAMCCSALFAAAVAVPVLFLRPDPAAEMSVRLQALGAAAVAEAAGPWPRKRRPWSRKHCGHPCC